MIVSKHLARATVLVAGLAAASPAPASDGTGFARASGSTASATSGVVQVGYSAGCTTEGAACVAGTGCSTSGSAAHGYRCSCPECSDPSAFERLCIKLGIKKREALHDHSTWAINHYRHLHHPKCPPYCHPSWGYYQTCWSRFPEETLWCPECPTAVDGAFPPRGPAATPAGPAFTPPPAPTRPMPAPAPAPMPEPPAVEQTPYEEPPVETPSAGMSSFRPPSSSTAVYQASIGNFESRSVNNPPFLTPVRVEAEHDVTTPPHPRNRWRMER